MLIDDNMYLKSMRKNIAKLAFSNPDDVSFIQVFFNIPLPTALERNKERFSSSTSIAPIPSQAIIAMHSAMEAPKTTGGEMKARPKCGWNKRTIIFNEDELNLLQKRNADDWRHLFFDPVMLWIDIPVRISEEISKEKLTEVEIIQFGSDFIVFLQQETFLNEADLMLRTLVTKTIATAKEEKMQVNELRMLGKELSEKKRKILDGLFLTIFSQLFSELKSSKNEIDKIDEVIALFSVYISKDF
jgi:hypothetical protein